jgi:phage terminase large subunit
MNPLDTIKSYKTDIELFNKHFFNNQPLIDYQWDIWRSVRDNKRSCVRASFGTGKSFIAARIALWFYYTFPSSMVIFTAPTYTLLEKILWREIRSQHKQISFQTGVIVLETPIIKDPKNPDHSLFGFTVQTEREGSESLNSKFQGLHSKHILCILDESAGLHEEIFGGAVNMSTSEHSRILSIGNSTDGSSYFASLFRSGPPESPAGWAKFKIDAFMSPNIKAGKVVMDNLPTTDWIEWVKTEWGEDSQEYKVKVLAEFPSLSPDALYSLSDIENAFSRTPSEIQDKNIHKNKTMGIDCSGEGNDYHCAYLLDGPLARCVYYRQLETTDTLVATYSKIAKENKVTDIVVDQGGGYGKGIYDGLVHLKHNVHYWNNASQPSDTTRFHSLKDEVAFGLKGRLSAGNICIEKDDYLKQELSQIRSKLTVHRGFNVNHLEDKDKMKQRIKRSPDRYEALLMALSPTIRPKFELTIG